MEWTEDETQALTDELESIRNMIDLALLALDNEEYYLVPTAIEEAFQKIQDITDTFCVVEDDSLVPTPNSNPMPPYKAW